MPLAPMMMPNAGPAGPAAAPTANPGEAVAAAAQVRQALKILEAALPKLPIGSDMYDACVEAIRKLSKAYPATDEMPGIQNTALLGLQQQAREGAMMRQLMASMGGGGQPQQGPPPGGGMAPPGM